MTLHAASRAGSATRSRRRLRRAGAIAAIAVLALLPVQMSVFALAWPPPGTAQETFDLFARSRTLGLLSLDVLLLADWMLLLVLWAALYVALAPTDPRTMLVAVLLTAAATVAYSLSNTAFEILALSDRFAASTDPLERADLLMAGDAALARFEGPWFTASYLLSGAATLLASLAMWRAPGFGRVVGGVGIAYALLQAVPPNAGTVGMVLSVVSLVPMVVWLALVARALMRPGVSSAASRI